MDRRKKAFSQSAPFWLALGALWLGLVAFGTAKLELFAATPGRAATRSSVAAGHRFHLYCFLHPLCPCSRATVAEIQRMMGRTSAPLDVEAIIDVAGLKVSDAEGLEKQLASGPQIGIDIDRDGTKTASFGARTSGEVLLYGPSGELAFSGGVTAERGHEGDNTGIEAVRDILAGRQPQVRHTSTFGCALTQPRETS